MQRRGLSAPRNIRSTRSGQGALLPSNLSTPERAATTSILLAASHDGSIGATAGMRCAGGAREVARKNGRALFDHGFTVPLGERPDQPQAIILLGAVRSVVQFLPSGAGETLVIPGSCSCHGVAVPATVSST